MCNSSLLMLGVESFAREGAVCNIHLLPVSYLSNDAGEVFRIVALKTAIERQCLGLSL